MTYRWQDCSPALRSRHGRFSRQVVKAAVVAARIKAPVATNLTFTLNNNSAPPADGPPPQSNTTSAFARAIENAPVDFLLSHFLVTLIVFRKLCCLHTDPDHAAVGRARKAHSRARRRWRASARQAVDRRRRSIRPKSPDAGGTTTSRPVPQPATSSPLSRRKPYDRSASGVTTIRGRTSVAKSATTNHTNHTNKTSKPLDDIVPRAEHPQNWQPTR